MPRNYYLKVYGYGLAVLLAVIAVGLFAPLAKAQAANPPDQTVKNYQASGGFEGMPAFALGTGLSGTVTSFVVNITNPGSTIVYDNLDPDAGGVWGYISLANNAQSSFTYYCPEDATIPSGTNDVTWFPCPSETAHTWNGADNQLILQVNGPSGYGKPPWYINGTSSSVTGYSPQSGNTMLAPYILWNQGGGPEGDGSSASHIIRITDPISLETTASTTVAVGFDFIVGSSTPANAYEISLERLAGGGGITYFRDDLIDAVGGEVTLGLPYSVTDTVIAPYEGTYKMSIRLVYYEGEYVEDAPVLYNVDVGKTVVFSAVTVDYTAITLVSEREYTIYDESSCLLDWSLTFNVSDCVGYLFAPGPDVWSKYSTLTLRNSFPFSYVYQFDDIREAIFNSPFTGISSISTEVEGFGTITFISYDMIDDLPFSDTLRVFIQAFIWFLVAFALYRMVLKLHDTNTSV